MAGVPAVHLPRFSPHWGSQVRGKDAPQVSQFTLDGQQQPLAQHLPLAQSVLRR
jgi:hypothetical protein